MITDNQISVRNSIIIALIIFSITFLLSDANILQKFTPRYMCMYSNEKLIMLHMVSDFAIFVSYMGIGYCLYRIYDVMKSKQLPFTDFFWQFGGFITCCGITHLIGVINIYVSFYWIDGIFKLLTAWFSVLVFIHLIKDINKIKAIKTPEEYKALSDKLNELLKEIKKS